MTRTPDETRDLIHRLHLRLSSQLWPGEVTILAKRFVTNHRFAENDPILPALRKVTAAHLERTRGQSSPAACDVAAKEAAA